MKLITTRTDKSTSAVIGLIIDGAYLILADGHRNGILHNIYDEFTVEVGGSGHLSEVLTSYGTDRATPIYMGDIITIETGN